MKARIWDLDNTIYENPDGFFESCYQTAAEMAVAQGYPYDVPAALQTAYTSFDNYGYALAAFFTEHGLDRPPLEEPYVQHVANLLIACNETNQFIRKFPGPQLVMSHSNRAWIDAIMSKLGLDDIIPPEWRLASEDIGHKGKKTSVAAYQKAAEILGVSPSGIEVFEDTIENLAHAKTLGMTTIWVTNGKDGIKPEFVDYQITRPYHYKY
jgi:putative hydrolase of the HAD superfamily